MGGIPLEGGCMTPFGNGPHLWGIPIETGTPFGEKPHFGLGPHLWKGPIHSWGPFEDGITFGGEHRIWWWDPIKGETPFGGRNLFGG